MPMPDLEPLCPGEYVTDGTRLLRIVTSLVRPPHAGLIELEDCRSLDVMLMPIDDLTRLRPVRPREQQTAIADAA